MLGRPATRIELTRDNDLDELIEARQHYEQRRFDTLRKEQMQYQQNSVRQAFALAQASGHGGAFSNVSGISASGAGGASSF